MYVYERKIVLYLSTQLSEDIDKYLIKELIKIYFVFYSMIILIFLKINKRFFILIVKMLGFAVFFIIFLKKVYVLRIASKC